MNIRFHHSYYHQEAGFVRNGVLLRPKPQVWEMTCGVLGAHTKYLETYRVLGNQNMQNAMFKRYSQFTDTSYESNIDEVDAVLHGLVPERPLGNTQRTWPVL